MSAESIFSEGKIDEDFSVIEHSADAIRIEEDIDTSQQGRKDIVQDLYEGPRKCQCCINWMEECPHDVDPSELNKDDEETENSAPLVIRRRVTPGEKGNVVSIHSIEIRHAAVRKVLVDVFNPLDHVVHEVKYLTFLAPFLQFFWRWEQFEKAVKEEKEEGVKVILETLRVLIKRELAEAFAVSKELLSHGVITFDYLWTLFTPGELLYSNDDSLDRFYILRSVSSRGGLTIEIGYTYITWSGGRDGFGTVQEHLPITLFHGTRSITSLPVFPAKYLSNFASMQEKLIQRGRKFANLAGIHYKAYRTESLDASSELRVMIDSSRSQLYLANLIGDPEDEMFPQLTGLIRQSPVDSPPAGGHIPLEQWENEFNPRGRDKTAFSRYPPPRPRRESPPPIFEPRSPPVAIIRRARRSSSAGIGKEINFQWLTFTYQAKK